MNFSPQPHTNVREYSVSRIASVKGKAFLAHAIENVP
jgi:hypothetical protein